MIPIFKINISHCYILKQSLWFIKYGTDTDTNKNFQIILDSRLGICQLNLSFLEKRKQSWLKTSYIWGMKPNSTILVNKQKVHVIIVCISLGRETTKTWLCLHVWANCGLIINQAEIQSWFCPTTSGKLGHDTQNSEEVLWTSHKHEPTIFNHWKTLYRIFLTVIVLSERKGHTWKKVVTFIFHLDKCMCCCAEGYIPVIKASDKQVLNFCQLLLKITDGIRNLVREYLGDTPSRESQLWYGSAIISSI